MRPKGFLFAFGGETSRTRPLSRPIAFVDCGYLETKITKLSFARVRIPVAPVVDHEERPGDPIAEFCCP